MNRNGKSFLIPPHRRLSWDLLRFNRNVPLCGHDRVCNLSALDEARSASLDRISWPAIFLKAWAIVSADVPAFRQTWYRWPIAHLYQHPHNIGTLTVSREYKGEQWLFWGVVPKPEKLALPELQHTISDFTSLPPKMVFRNQVRLARLPTMLRRLCWGWNIHVAKASRARRLGTFFLSTLAGRGAEIQVPPSVQTCCLTYGPISTNGECRITLAYDHRVMDGVVAADGLRRLEETLLKTLRAELLQHREPKDIITDLA